MEKLANTPPDTQIHTRKPLLLSQTSRNILSRHMEKIVSGEALQDNDVIETKL